MWRWLLSILTWLSADPAALELEPARASAAVSAARASMMVDAPAPAPAPKPGPAKCCGECGGRGYIVMPDGHRVACPCAGNCACKTKATAEAPCPDGKCPPKTVLR